VHWLALLRAPWCGLTLADLHALAAGDRRRTVWELMHDPARCAALSDDGRVRLGHVRDVLALAFAERDRRPPRRWLEGVWLMLGGPCCLEAPTALADVDVFFGLVDRLTAAGSLNPDRLAAQAAELYAPPDPAGSAVQMMTIHKAKGLEFETVIVPGLHRTTGGSESQLLLWDEFAGTDGHEHLLVAPIRARGAADEEASAYRFLQALETRRTAHESQRLLYVAATRAIRHLHLVGCALPDPAKDDGLKPPPAGSLLRLLWPGVAQPVFAAALAGAGQGQATPSAIDPSTYVPPLLRLAAPAVPDALRALPGLRSADNPPAALAGDEAPSLEAAVGTLVHRILEIVAGEGVSTWPAARIAALEPAWRRWLAARGYTAPESAGGAAEAVRALQATLASADGRWLLAAHPEAAAEQAWTSREGDVTVNHVIDRVFVADGCRWIVDYKTVRAADDELPARAEGFRPQLERYARLFADDPLPLRQAVFFTLQARLVELTPAPH
jgi:ATP-dependent exoDNAse (exonuclease V) beta subunit